MPAIPLDRAERKECADLCGPASSTAEIRHLSLPIPHSRQWLDGVRPPRQAKSSCQTAVCSCATTRDRYLYPLGLGMPFALTTNSTGVGPKKGEDM